ncbi:hypothetical protein CNMCM5623_001255 [Aspergillus felis]|uniref:Uncharacterized protein n=1 Tax=Aspergillus felis TaxID=1287682 RepID=A0A8H6Q8U4_9EURO|nr:hypothetical protein CNMCM5623_001255 [Aspergillus felis]KAF7177652.1 hypothetical protein CNMCM7691_006013 [Aspergillus felis]
MSLSGFILHDLHGPEQPSASNVSHERVLSKMQWELFPKILTHATSILNRVIFLNIALGGQRCNAAQRSERILHGGPFPRSECRGQHHRAAMRAACRCGEPPHNLIED